MITQEYLKSILYYDPETGLFTWIRSLNKRIIVGNVAGYHDAYGYVVIGINGKYYKAHRLAFLYMIGRFPILDGEHKDMKKDNNKWENLREASDSENRYNTPVGITNKLGIKGVHQRGDKFIAQMTINGKVTHLGIFSSKDEAANAYRLKAIEVQGQFIHKSINDAEKENIG